MNRIQTLAAIALATVLLLVIWQPVFPSGWLVRDLDADGFADEASEVLVYYGAADTCVARCRTTVGALLEACARVQQ